MASQLSSVDGVEALDQLKSADPVLFVSTSVDLSRFARSASRHLFSIILPFCRKPPLNHLLVDGFDAEQIWHQIDLQTQPLILRIRRKLSQLQRNPEVISNIFSEIKRKNDGSNAIGAKNAILDDDEKNQNDLRQDKPNDVSDSRDDFDSNEETRNSTEDGDVEDLGDREEGNETEGIGRGIEDRFFKISELEEYLEQDEKREHEEVKKDEDEGETVEDDDEMGIADDGDEAADVYGIRYEDFFCSDKKKHPRKKLDKFVESDHLVDEDQRKAEDCSNESQNKEALSTHEKAQEKIRCKIEQMEKENLEPKYWTMRGEITAARRPKNSALEVELDFEHNARPPPVITEEVTASLEDLIKHRILEGHFDDVQRAHILPSKPPKELKALDDQKSKKGLAEIYEEEYAEKTGLAPVHLSFTDEQKKEATVLFKKLCLKLDALSHFHFSPKPIIEDMSIQSNVPALAMEEIAPMAVTDAAMLAPEEIFDGKGYIKDEAELTQAERKRRRANKKRKFKVKTLKEMAAERAQNSTLTSLSNGPRDKNL